MFIVITLVCIGHFVPCLLKRDEKEIKLHKFGLVPAYYKEYNANDHFKMFNARRETLREKPTFAKLITKDDRRCVTLIKGFYEWKKEGGAKKQPYYVSRTDGKLLLVASLRDEMKPEKDEEYVVNSVALITREATKKISWLHDRMPVILKDSEVAFRYIDKGMEVLEDDDALVGGEELVWWPVKQEMGNVSEQSASCCEKVIAVAQKNTQSITKMFQKVAAKKSAEKIEHVCVIDDDDDDDNEPAKKKLKM